MSESIRFKIAMEHTYLNVSHQEQTERLKAALSRQGKTSAADAMKQYSHIKRQSMRTSQKSPKGALAASK